MLCPTQFSRLLAADDIVAIKAAGADEEGLIVKAPPKMYKNVTPRPALRRLSTRRLELLPHFPCVHMSMAHDGSCAVRGYWLCTAAHARDRRASQRRR